MKDLITYVVGHHLYLNLTNRCTNRCTFCIRDRRDGIGHDLWLEREPTVKEAIDAIGAAEGYPEVVFCGFGEPLVRLPEVVEIARYLKSIGKKVRINTNGQADLIWGRSVAKELAGVVDSISISLNAADAKSYQAVCLSEFGESAYDAVIAFAASCVPVVPEVILSAVDVISVEDVEVCRSIAKRIGATFRLRQLMGDSGA